MFTLNVQGKRSVVQFGPQLDGSLCYYITKTSREEGSAKEGSKVRVHTLVGVGNVEVGFKILYGNTCHDWCWCSRNVYTLAYIKYMN